MAKTVTEPPIRDSKRPVLGYGIGLLAAVLFGASAPLSKRLIPSIDPVMLAGLLYLGAGIATLLLALARSGAREAPLQRSDAPTLAGMVLSGGVIGPILLMIGLSHAPAAFASLLLNLETPFTIFLAVLFFRDHLGRRELLGALLVVVAAIGLPVGAGPTRGGWIGGFAVTGACLSWALDNNLSQRVSMRDPLWIAAAKSLPAAALNLGLAFTSGSVWPTTVDLFKALATGGACYGLSIALYVRAVRELGAARQSILFAAAPFVGVVLAIPIAGESPRTVHIAAGSVMALGVWLMVRAHHGHRHAHEPITHEHAHVHDEHHQHQHDGPMTEPHSHVHTHERLEHEHEHAPDIHHRHRHGDG